MGRPVSRPLLHLLLGALLSFAAVTYILTLREGSAQARRRGGSSKRSAKRPGRGQLKPETKKQHKAQSKAQRKKDRKAEALAEEAEAALKSDRPGEALNLFQAAHDAAPLPRYLRRIGDCHRAMGNAGRAAFIYRSYLRRDSDPERHREVEELAQQMEALAAQVRGPQTIETPDASGAPGAPDANTAARPAPAPPAPALPAL